MLLEDGQAPAPLWDQWLTASLADLQERSLFRALRPVVPGLSAVEATMSQADIDAWAAGRPPASLACSGASHQQPQQLPCLADAPDRLRTVRLFSLNDYLGLSTHPAVRQAIADAALQCGNGPRSSALVGGYTSWHRELEAELAALKGTEDCLLFPSGFAANLAVASSLSLDGQGQGQGGSVLVLSDELNHASIVDGARLGRRGGGTQLRVYRHGDLQHLEELLQQCAPGQRAVVLTDSLFSMDGDFADLPGLARLRRRYGFLLVVDEAHATLVCGEGGGGAAEMFGVGGDVDLHVGTLSKAFGSLGGFVACSRQWKDFLVNRGRSQIYSTSLPVPVVAGALAALRTAREEPWRRERVWRLTRQLGAALGVEVTSPIVPLVIGAEQAAVDASMQLLQRGFHVPAIRPPTVPPGTSRLRVSLSAAHSDDDVRDLIEALRACNPRFRATVSGSTSSSPSGSVQGGSGVTTGAVGAAEPAAALLSRL